MAEERAGMGESKREEAADGGREMGWGKRVRGEASGTRRARREERDVGDQGARRALGRGREVRLQRQHTA